MRSNRSWPVRVLLREVVRNLRADWSWNLATFVLAVATAGFLLVSDLAAVSESITLERKLAAAGKYVVLAGTIDLSDGPAIDSRVCTDLARLSHVAAAGGISTLGIATISSHPGDSFRVYGGVGAIRRVLDPGDPAVGGDAVAASLSRQLGLRDQNLVSMEISSGPPRAAPGTVRVFNPSRHELGDGMWLVGNYTPTIDECWVEFEREAFVYGPDIVRSSFAAARNATITRLIPSDDLGLTPQEQFARRALRNNYPLLGMLLGAPFAIGIWLRRSRGGLYRSFGASKLKTATMIAAPEVWVAVFASACAWVGVRRWIVEAELVTGSQGWTVVTRGFLISSAVGYSLIVVASLAAAHGDITKQLKDRV